MNPFRIIMYGLTRQLGHTGGKVQDWTATTNGTAKYMHSRYGVYCFLFHFFFHLCMYDSPEIVRMGNILFPDGVSSTDIFVWHEI
jgi:hypothetical protein